ncbi:MAG: phosphoesterase, PA-phosphatase related protein [Jatrophihabitans sp.]|nr:phosphoesterase, PA-phosphatase related protein [Jatrophihabitans sp.]
MSHISWRGWAFIGVLIAYGLLTWSVLVRSPILTLDHNALELGLRIRMAHPHWYPALNTYAVLGQRAPTAVGALPWIIWVSYRRRSASPIITLLTALLVLNLSVGVVKIYIGRLGPIKTYNTYKIFSGGDIYPSGHVSNAVVLFGVLAMIAVNHKRLMVWLAVFISFTVGMVTIYLKTHWLSDVIGGWLAGSLVLLILPHVVPRLEVLGHHAIGRWLHLEPPERMLVREPVAVGAAGAGSEDADSGELLGELPEPSSERLVPSRVGGADQLRVPAEFRKPVRAVVAAPTSLRRRRGVESR